MALTPLGLNASKEFLMHRPPPTRGLLTKFGILQPQEVILGLFGEYVDLHERAWSGGLVQLLGDLGFTNASSRVALNRVIARGLLKPVKKGRFVFYTITPRLAIVHDEGRQQVFSFVPNSEWTGVWTLVCHHVPEEHRLQRARLGRWLSMRGFGYLQGGTWLGAGNSETEVMGLVTRLGLEKDLLIFVGSLPEGTDVQSTIERIWKIKSLRRMYEVFVTKFDPYRSGRKLANLQPREAFIVRTRLIEMFRQTTILDPRVSDSALKVDWRRSEAIEIFQEIQMRLNEPASHYFRSHAIGGIETA